MAEVLGVASSVAGLISLADIVVTRGYKFLKKVKDAENSVKSLIHETNVLAGVLHSLGNTVQLLEDDDDQASYDPTTQVHYIEACYQTLSKIQQQLSKALPIDQMSKFDKIRWPLKYSQTMELVQEIQRHKSTMSIAMGATEMSTLLKILARHDAVHQEVRELKSTFDRVIMDESRLKMLQYLCKIGFRQWQDSNIRLRQPGTGIWFIDGPDFGKWLAQDRSSLWIYGLPGAGKTILMSSIIQQLEQVRDRDTAVAFFYCDYKNTATHDPLAILGGLARQIIAQKEECFKDLEAFHNKHVSNDHSIRAPSPNELCELIKTCSMHFREVQIIVDGLDEIAENRADVTRLLSSLNNQSTPIKTLFASRPEIDIGYALEDIDKISIAAMSSDLRLYVGSEIGRRTKERKLNIRDPLLKEHIMTTLADGADGMFRWVACQIDYLCECSNDRDRREALKKLPPDLPSSYERILERVNRSTKENQRLVRGTLHWLAHVMITRTGKFTTTHLLQALAIREGDTAFESSAMTTEEELLYWCSSLVRKNRSDQILEFAHFTVKEFLQAIDPKAHPAFGPYHLSDDHTVLLESCVSFLNCSSFNGQPMPYVSPTTWNTAGDCWVFMRSVPFLSYANTYWLDHFYESKSTHRVDLIMPLFNSKTSPNFSLWTFLYFDKQCYKPGYSRHVPSSPDGIPSALHWAASLRLSEVCERLIEAGADVNKQSVFGKPLSCALLLYGAMFDLDTYMNSLDFDDFFSEAHLKTVEVIINAGADINTNHVIGDSWSLTTRQLALEIDSWNPDAEFVLTMFLLGIGCLDLVGLVDDARRITRLDRHQDYQTVTPGFSDLWPSKIIAYGPEFVIVLPPELYFEYFVFVLDYLSSWQLLHIDDGYAATIAGIAGIDFGSILPDIKVMDSKDGETFSQEHRRVFDLVCRVIRTLSETPLQANNVIEASLKRAFYTGIPWYIDLYNTAGIQIAQQGLLGNTVLHDAVQHHDEILPGAETLQSCDTNGHPMDTLNDAGFSALALAVRCKNGKAVKVLLRAGACPDTRILNGQTALHLACRLGNSEAVEELLECWADPSIEDDDGLKPIDIASRCQYPNLVTLLQEDAQLEDPEFVMPYATFYTQEPANRRLKEIWASIISPTVQDKSHEYQLPSAGTHDPMQGIVEDSLSVFSLSSIGTSSQEEQHTALPFRVRI